MWVNVAYEILFLNISIIFDSCVCVWVHVCVGEGVCVRGVSVWGSWQPGNNRSRNSSYLKPANQLICRFLENDQWHPHIVSDVINRLSFNTGCMRDIHILNIVSYGIYIKFGSVFHQRFPSRFQHVTFVIHFPHIHAEGCIFLDSKELIDLEGFSL